MLRKNIALRLAATAALATLLPMAASAATIGIGTDTGTYSLGNCGATEVLGQVTSGEGGAGSHIVTFEACNEPSLSVANASVTMNVGANFTDLTVEWSGSGDGPLSIVDDVTLVTLFEAGNNPQDLIFAWTDSLARIGFDYDVNISPVPVPAAGLLLLAGIGALGVAGRRKAA